MDGIFYFDLSTANEKYTKTLIKQFALSKLQAFPPPAAGLPESLFLNQKSQFG
jgi:hypothetical protein